MDTAFRETLLSQPYRSTFNIGKYGTRYEEEVAFHDRNGHHDPAIGEATREHH